MSESNEVETVVGQRRFGLGLEWFCFVENVFAGLRVLPCHRVFQKLDGEAPIWNWNGLAWSACVSSILPHSQPYSPYAWSAVVSSRDSWEPTGIKNFLRLAHRILGRTFEVAARTQAVLINRVVDKQTEFQTFVWFV